MARRSSGLVGVRTFNVEPIVHRALVRSVADAAIGTVLLNGTLVVAPPLPSLTAMPPGPGDPGALAAELPANALANAVADRPWRKTRTRGHRAPRREPRCTGRAARPPIFGRRRGRTPPRLDQSHRSDEAPSSAFSAALILWRESHTRRERKLVREAACVATATATPPASSFLLAARPSSAAIM